MNNAQKYHNLAWMDKASCRGADLSEFYTNSPLQSKLTIERYCSKCPVVNECLEYALSKNDFDGIWGAMTPRERNRIKKRGKLGAGILQLS